jgi:hypothetical protein
MMTCCPMIVNDTCNLSSQVAFSDAVDTSFLSFYTKSSISWVLVVLSSVIDRSFLISWRLGNE